MLSAIIQSESHYNALLPVKRLKQSPSPELVAAAGAWSLAVWEKGYELGPMPITPEEVDKGRKLAQHPVFICGAHRSGTTLVRDLLDGHPQLVVLPSEGTFYTNLEDKLLSLTDDQQAAFLGKEWLRRLANPINQPPYWLLGSSTESGSPYVNFVRYLLSWWKILDHVKGTQWPHTIIMLSYAACTGALSARSWVDKTPTNERFINRIWKEMPGAKIIQIIREPTAVLASRKRTDPGFNLRNVLTAIRTSFSIALRQSALQDPRYLLLRYDDLCETPALQIERLVSFININSSTELLRPTVAGRLSTANSSFNSNGTAGEIITSSQHRYEDLTLPERRLLAAYTGTLSRKLHYPQVQIGLLHSLYLKLENLTRLKFQQFLRNR